MKTNNKKNEINSLFICRKCNSVPLVEIVPKESDLKILITCKCNKQKLIKKEIFYKYYYNDNHMDIDINKKIENEKFKKLLDKYEEFKNHFMNNYQKIKEKINNLLNNILQQTEIVIEKNKKYNEEIDKIIQILIKNYELNPHNEINKENIMKNIHMNPYMNFKEFDFREFDKNITNINKTIQLYFKYNYLISLNKYEIIQSIRKEDLIIHLDKNIFASLKKNEYINIFDIDNLSNNIKIKKENSLDNILIDEKKRYLISLENDHFIKFRSLNEIMNNLSNENYKQKEHIDISPIFIIEHSSQIKNLINLENNLLGLFDENNINIYKYNIENNSSEIINKSAIKLNSNNSLFNPNVLRYTKLLKRKNKNSICSYNNGVMNIYEIPSLINEKNINIQRNNIIIYQNFIYEQISENEIIYSLNKYIYILNIENGANRSFISKRINFEIMSLKILKDNTLLIGGRSEIRRLYVKTLENLSNLISFDEDDDEEYDYNFIGLNRNENDVGSIIELNDGKLMLVLSYDIKIYGNKFKEYLNNNL